MKSKFFLLLIFLCLTLAFLPAQTAAPGAQTQKSFLEMLMENVLLLTILIIFISSIIRTVLRQRSKESCLKDFENFSVLLRLNTGKTIWGKMRLFSSGIELDYKKPYLDPKKNLNHYSYILFKPELENGLTGIFRYHEDLSPRTQKRRMKRLKKTYRPGPFVILGRTIKNILNTLKDAFSRSINVLVGHIEKQVSGGKVVKQTGDIGADLIEATGVNSYDPILEKYIGKKVIVKILDNEVHTEYEGILKEYTTGYIELLNILYDFQFYIELDEIKQEYEFSCLYFTRQEGILKIRNLSGSPLFLETLKEKETGDLAEKKADGQIDLVLKHEIPPGESFEIETKDDKKTLILTCKTSRLVDLIAPRTTLLMKHGGAKHKKLTFEQFMGLDKMKRKIHQ